MPIYRISRNLFRIFDAMDVFEWQRDMARLVTLRSQGELDAHISRLQGCKAKARGDEK